MLNKVHTYKKDQTVKGFNGDHEEKKNSGQCFVLNIELVRASVISGGRLMFSRKFFYSVVKFVCFFSFGYFSILNHSSDCYAILFE